jgi:membrane peptidoglycan carboxypeptidase
MLGRRQPYFYELRMEKFKYSQEVIASGVAEIDDVVYESAYQLHLNLGTVTGKYAINEIVFQSPDSTYANATSLGTVQTWIPSSNTLSISNIAGEFTNGQSIIGQTSNAHGSLIQFDPLKDPAYREVYDNEYIANSAMSVIYFSETNPFGKI